MCSVIQLCLALWTVARQAPLSVGFFRQEHWNGLPFPSPGDLPDPGIEPRSPALQGDALTSEPPGKPLMSGSSLACRDSGNDIAYIHLRKQITDQ